MLRPKKNKKGIKWLRINMRNINHLLGVEFLHDLYNRHLPQINSIRFRNTIVTWKDKVANSFAPEEEWQLLGKWLSEKFLRLDPILTREVKKLTNRKPIFLENFLKQFPRDLTSLSNIELGLLLIDLHYFVLGELYPVNLVQLEHSLSIAIQEILKKYIKEESKRMEVFSKIIIPRELTEFQKEKIAFLKIVKLGQRLKISDPCKNKKIYQLLFNHWNQYKFLNCAYGEDPKEFDFYLDEYKKLFSTKIKVFSVIKEVKKKYEEGEGLLKSINDFRLRILTDLIRRVGVFRDKNKARLGNTIKYRLMILDEIARRKLEKRQNLNYYLLTEILKLLTKKEKLPIKTIISRQKRGVTLYREEYLKEGVFKPPLLFEKKKKIKFLKGICASPGSVVGKCKIVISKEDIKNLTNNDIMVAIGTDFDLLEGIYKAKGVITEEGGILSHAAVVCRELKKPCCIGVKNATYFLKGKKVKLNASRGKIEII
jgi:phosphohistidine swiveling domain-containing protein